MTLPSTFSAANLQAAAPAADDNALAIANAAGGGGTQTILNITTSTDVGAGCLRFCLTLTGSAGSGTAGGVSVPIGFKYETRVPTANNIAFAATGGAAWVGYRIVP